jgi:hypothetical protein
VRGDGGGVKSDDRKNAWSSINHSGPEIYERLRRPEIDSAAYVALRASITNTVQLSNRPVGLHIGWRNRFPGSVNVYKFGLCTLS